MCLAPKQTIETQIRHLGISVTDKICHLSVQVIKRLLSIPKFLSGKKIKKM